MKVSELCKMIEDSMHSGKYPFSSEAEENFSPTAQIINRSAIDDLKSQDIRVEIRVKDFFVLLNFVPNIQHLPGVIEADVLDSFKIICRKIERIDASGLTSIKK